jgi:RNA recognition motif-containing protein
MGPGCVIATHRFQEQKLKRIYVGNLSYQTTEESLESAFAAFGTVNNVSIVRDRETGQSRGFGFVEMNDDAQATAAIDGLNGTQVDGRAVTVNEARPRTGGGTGGGSRGGREFRGSGRGESGGRRW